MLDRAIKLLADARRIIFDFEKDVPDLVDRLEKAEKTERRLVAEATDLHDSIRLLRQENERLHRENEELKKTLSARG